MPEQLVQAKTVTMDAPLEFNLSAVEPKERFSYWHDVGSQIQRPVLSRYQAPDDIRVNAKMLITSELILGQMASTPQHYERTDTMIRRDHNDNFVLHYLKTGSLYYNSRLLQTELQAGDLLLLDSQDSSQTDWSEHQMIYAILPRDLLKAAGWKAPQSGVLRAADPRATLLSQHLRTLWGLGPAAFSAMGTELALGLASLTRLYFHSQTLLPDAEQENSLTTLMLSIRQWLDDNLHRSELDATAIASHFHLSRSTLYELFRPWGGVRTYLQGRRLELARVALEAADQKNSISKLAIRLGFRSISSFSRAFRDRWGLSPQQFRDQRPDSKAVDAPTDGMEDVNGSGGAEKRLRQHTDSYYKAINQLRGGATGTPQTGPHSD